ncbi:GtrA family protein [Nocardioides sp. KR10-350]|uniref:GtrA family protein n=1 Tax=Nocardioides cheoyonin TaxID=3156615 RepID=UPI0032B5056B
MRAGRLAGEAGRFMAVGGIATAVAFVLFNLLAHGLFVPAVLPSHPILSYVLANTVGMLISYELSRRWTFRYRASDHPDGGFTAYVVINVATMTIPVACLWINRNWLGLSDPISDNIAANVIGILLSQVARFYLFRRFVFHRPIRYTEVYEDPRATARAARVLDEITEEVTD